MRKYQLMGGVAAAAVALLLPLNAYAQSAADFEDEMGDAMEVRPEGLQYGLRGVADITYENEIETEIETDIDFTKDVLITGTVTLSGAVVTDAAAVAVVDNKQALVGNTLIYTEENEINGENGWVDPVFGPGVSEAGQDPNDGLVDGAQQDRIRVGFFAPVINTVNSFSVDVAGNVGLNFSAGNYNIQENIAALASSTFEGDEEGTGGLAEASLTALQLGVGNSIGSNQDQILDEDDPELGGGGNNFRVRNTVFGGAMNVAADGNLGINAAAGAMNMQKNALVMAVATDSAMAEATAAVIQASVGNFVEVQDEINVVNPGTYTGSGNLGVNLTAGSYNQQMNSLVAAVGLAGAGNGGPTPPPPPPPPSEQSSRSSGQNWGVARARSPIFPGGPMRYCPVIPMVLTALAAGCTTMPQGVSPFLAAQGQGSQPVYKPLSSWKERKFTDMVRQQTDFSCGAAALATIFNFAYGKKTSEQQILVNMLKIADPDLIREKGFSLLDMKNYVTAVGMTGQGYEVEYDALKQLKVPAIALLDIRNYKHFVVIRKVDDAYVHVADPALGNRLMRRGDFEKSWNKVVFVVVGEGFDEDTVLMNPPPPLSAARLYGLRSPVLNAEAYDFGLGPAYGFVF